MKYIYKTPVTETVQAECHGLLSDAISKMGITNAASDSSQSAGNMESGGEAGKGDAPSEGAKLANWDLWDTGWD